MTEYETRATLLLQIRNPQDEQAWEEFARIYTPLIYRFCLSRGLQDADASDVVQDVMKAIARAIQSFEYDPNKGSFRSWLYTVVRSKLNNWFGKRYKHPQGSGRTTVQQMIEAQPDESDAADMWEKAYRTHVLEWACEKLKDEFQPKTWQAFQLVALDQQGAEAVAKELGMSVGSVYIAKSRVIARMRDLIEHQLGDLDPDLLDQ